MLFSTIIFSIELLIILYLLIFTYLHWYLFFKRKSTISAANNKWWEDNLEEGRAKHRLIKVISSYYGSEKAQLVNDGQMWVGMPVDLLRISLGMESDSKKNVKLKNETTKLYYGAFVNNRGNTKYSREVLVKNGKVIGWRDLDS